MSYKFDAHRMYRMPTHFGPSLGPRQGPEGRKFPCRHNPKTTTISVSFLADRSQLDDLLPEGFTVGNEPVVTVAASYMKEIEWLAGRGYNILGVSWPVLFEGQRDRASGDFLSVLWENMCDPIVTGREELGYAKMWAELPEPHVCDGKTTCTASWDGYPFLEMEVTALKELPLAPPAPPPTAAKDDVLHGILHYKYVPRTGHWGQTDLAYACLTPAATPNLTVREQWQGKGAVRFHRATWEQMPTQCHIVNAFADLKILEYRGARLVRTVGSKDLGDQRILH